MHQYIVVHFNISTFKYHFINPLSANPTIWSDTLKLFVGKSHRIVWVRLTILWGWRLKARFLAAESPLQMMKNAFYVTFKAHIVLEIFKFLTSQPGQQTIAIHVLHNISRSKGNQTMKFRQLIECNMKHFSWNIRHKMWEKLVPDPFLKN